MNLFNSPHIWSESDFRKLLRSQRDLADRHGTPCAVITLDTHHTSRSQRKRLLHHLAERVRTSDCMGNFEGDLGVLLRSTDLEGARNFVSDVRLWMRTHNLDVSMSVLMYPTPPGGAELYSGIKTRAADLAPHLLPKLGFIRRLFDIAVSATMLLVLAPLLGLVAIVIKLDSPGPVIFPQERLGRGARRFWFFKFRSMCTGAESKQASLEGSNEKDGPIFKIKDDPRITRVGKFTRRWSIDELPQLFNVLRGDMTLVGPRPPKACEVEQYEPWQKRRLDLVGGLTCIWQVSGRSNVSFTEWMRMDRRYAKTRNLLLDFSLLARTVPALLTARGAY